MEMWLRQGAKKLRFPVLPGEYTISGSQANTTVNINALGEINLLGKPGLRTINFSSFFPRRAESFCEFSDVQRPRAYVEQLEEMKRCGPMRLYISGCVSMKVTIEQFEHGESDGTGDIQFTLELKEYRNLSIPMSAVQDGQEAAQGGQAGETDTRDTSGTDKPSSYTVQKGDTLSGIARKIMGAADWRPLYEANREVIGSNPNQIQIGMVLVIP